MKRLSVWTVCLAAAMGLCHGQQANPKPAEQQQETQPPKQQPPATPPAQTGTTPAAGAPAAQPPDAAKPPAGEPAAPPSDTDPLKMAGAGDKLPVVKEVDRTYVLGSDDGIAVSVWGSPALSSTYMIRPDGRISMPLIGEIQAAGLTPVRLGEQITERLKEGGILRQPNVVVILTAVQSKKYQILGEVNKPGSYPITAPTNILEALVNAGGFREFASKKNIILQREIKCNGDNMAAPAQPAAKAPKAKGKKDAAAAAPPPCVAGVDRHKFNYNQVIKGQHLEQNIPVQPGDLIIVK